MPKYHVTAIANYRRIEYFEVEAESQEEILDAIQDEDQYISEELEFEGYDDELEIEEIEKFSYKLEVEDA